MKKHIEAHASSSKFGMGDHYGTGIRQKLGRMRGDSIGMIAMTPKKLQKPPRSIA